VLPPAEAHAGLAAYVHAPITRHPHLPLLLRGFEFRDNFSPYDAMYVALAEAIDAALLTADDRLARAVIRHTSIPVLP
jgi:predicted nucleic acid-binding protein